MVEKMSFDRGNEELKKAEKDPKKSLLRTLGSALIIASLISVLGTFYALHSRGSDVLMYVWFLVCYGVYACLGVALGSVCLFASPKPLWPIFGVVLGGILFGGGIVNGIFLSSWPIAISISVIGACVGAIALLSFLQMKE